ncbi:hypothetical protein COT77_01970 [Candidatus Berkelbacteria bacterium CG10_big_fil_rev_8_21_14_0_10_41_12]|uniref:LTD domain-containing protein n=1 Tax=Candidatus Berkelbacteria bacterium CG10_big_fil_rev_8_21_14_0_10_41_12 TaxID=1974513 RepID=A0A2M6WX39_9BACT|nr:MAG: hypothetical protein COT77_01970 [Candidatus Berkelbacteria bacterium CG10_big_fil_rev_8_21_14_0_10_41_12]
MKKYFVRFFYPIALIFLMANFTGAYFSDNISVSGNFSAADSGSVEVVINEIMANPVGDDAAVMPGGEWVELYNKGTWAINVNGWYLYDSINSHDLLISVSNVGGGSTVIPVGGYLVVYRNSDGSFELNNTTTDEVRLFDGPIGSSTLIDNFSYAIGTIFEGQSWVRVPNGSATWLQNQSPTKGFAN